MSPAKDNAQLLEIDGREVRISNPDKVVFPEPGLTKLDLVNYYLAVADGALRGVAGRPMVLKRFVKGISQEAFFQKRAPEKRPEWIDTATLHYASGNSAEEVVVTDAAALAWVVNLGCIDLNPHPVRADDLEHPDELRVDLDPMPGRRLEPDRRRRHGRARGAHRPRARRLAEDLGLTRHPHLRAHRAALDFREVRHAAETLAREVELRAPGPRDRALVEGGARRERVRRLQPEREGPHGRVGVLDPSAARRARLDAARLGRGARQPPRAVHGPDGARAVRRARRPRRGNRRRRRRTRRPAAPRRGARTRREAARSRRDGSGRRQSTMPLIEVARTKTKPEALEALERWKAKHPDVVALLQPADVLVDGMRGLVALVPHPREPAARPRGAAPRAGGRSRPTTTRGPARSGTAS